MKKNREEAQNQPRRKVIRYLKLAVVVFFIIFSVEIWIVSRLATYGKKIQHLKDSEAGLILENQVLENEIAQRSSLRYLENKASKYGFVRASNISYLKPNAVAALP